jgi:LPXTG-motif cell wall-anchored protein
MPDDVTPHLPPDVAHRLRQAEAREKAGGEIASARDTVAGDAPPATGQAASWQWPLLIGLVLIGLGIACFYKVINSQDQDHMLIGVLMIVAGLAQGAHAVMGMRWSHFIDDFAPSILFLLGGVIVLSDPLTGSFVLTLLLAAALVLTSLFRLASAWRGQAPGGWRIWAVAGAVSVALWLWLLWTWPRSGVWVLGTVVGLDLLASGIAWLQRAWAARG